MQNRCIACGPFLVTVTAVLFSLLGTMWCQMVSIDPVIGQGDDVLAMQSGLFLQRKVHDEGFYGDETGIYFMYSNYCVPFDDYSKYDAKWMSAAALQAVNWLIAGVIIMPALMLDSCFSFLSRTSYLVFGVTMALLCTIFQGLTFLVFSSNMCTDNPEVDSNFLGDFLFENYCYLGVGGKVNAAAVALYFLAGATCYCAAPDKPVASAEGEQQDKEKEENQEGPIQAETGLGPETAPVISDDKETSGGNGPTSPAQTGLAPDTV